MQALLEALLTRVGSDAALAQIAGTAPSMYLGEAPENARMPFITLRFAAGAEKSEHDFAGDRITHAAVDISVIAESLATALALADRLTVLLDAASFALSAGTLLDCRQIAAPRPVRAGFDSANNEVYRVDVRLICSVFNAAGV